MPDWNEKTSLDLRDPCRQESNGKMNDSSFELTGMNPAILRDFRLLSHLAGIFPVNSS